MTEPPQDREGLARALIGTLVHIEHAVGPVHLLRSEERLADMLNRSSFDVEPAARKHVLSAVGASSDPSVLVQASALVAAGRLSWSDLCAAWEESPGAAPWLTARLSAIPTGSPFVDRARSDIEDAELTSAFLACCPEVRGPNALTRAGALTDIRLDGSCWVAKQRARSTGLPEEVAHEAIIERMDLVLRGDGTFSASVSSDLEVVVPSQQRVVSTPDWTLERRLQGPTLEALFLDGSAQTHHLAAVRTLSESLLERGIEWGDLSPRNILVLPSVSGRTTLGLVDFEKVRLADPPLGGHAAFQFVRAGMAIEEFGPLCTPEEMDCLFGNSWLDGTRPHQPRRELTHLLRHRGVSADDVAAVDEVDTLIWQVRKPLVTHLGRLLPGTINIRLQHYTACLGRGARSYVLEHLLTAGLVRSLELGSFESAVAAASRVVADLEDLAVEAEFVRRWTAATGTTTPWSPLAAESALTKAEFWIDRFATACTDTEMANVLSWSGLQDRAGHGR